jgi:maleamate amidohydrolase
MSVSPSEQDFFAAKGFGDALGFGRRPAVFVIDLLYAFTDPSFDLGSDLGPVIEATNRVLDATHDATVDDVLAQAKRSLTLALQNT